KARLQPRCARPRRRSRFAGRLSNRSAILTFHMTPFGYRIVPVLARVRPGFALRLNRGEADDAFEVPLAFLMARKTTSAKVAIGMDSTSDFTPCSSAVTTFGARRRA